MIHLDRSRCSICGEKFTDKETAYEVSAQEIRPPGKRSTNIFRVVIHDRCLLEQALH